MSARYDIHGRVAFITGAARGIGAETARRLHGLGAKVMLVGLEPELLETLASQLGSGAAWCKADVTDTVALQAAVEATVQRFGGIDIVIANAGVLHLGAVADAVPHQFERTLEVNLFGVWRTLRATLPQVLERRGYVLTVASVAALGHGPLMGAYAASKAAVEAITDSLRIELAQTGVHVGCAYFGAVDTDLVRGSRKHPAIAALESLTPKFLGAEITLTAAVDVIENGIRRRAARIWAPRWVGAFLLLRGFAQPLLERMVASDPRLARALALARPGGSRDGAQDDLLGTAAKASRKPDGVTHRQP